MDMRSSDQPMALSVPGAGPERVFHASSLQRVKLSDPWEALVGTGLTPCI